MNQPIRISVAVFLLVGLIEGPVTFAQDTGLKDRLVLIAPIGSETAYLINAEKQVVHSWPCGGGAGNATYLLKDGNLLRTGKVENPVFQARGGAGGYIKRIAWDGTVQWEYSLSNDEHLSHHDVEPMPNGNVLVIAWEYRSRADAIAAGRNPETMSQDALWPERILELKPQGTSEAEVVWEWHLWDHLIQDFDDTKANFGKVADHPELVNLNYGIRRGGSDWIHMNSIDYNPKLDQIVLSARWFDEMWIIDHSTTTQEAAGHSGGKHGRGGDLLYRWGNPEAYGRGTASDRQFFAQHDVRWIESGYPGEGHFTLFNNGNQQTERNYSSADEFAPPLNSDGSYGGPDGEPFGPEVFVWSYSDKEHFASNRISGAQRLPNGNTLVCSGEQGWVFEVTPEGKRIWEFELSEISPTRRGGGGLFRAPTYAADSSAFREKF